MVSIFDARCEYTVPVRTVSVRARYGPYVLENTCRIIRSLYVAHAGPGDGRECTYGPRTTAYVPFTGKKDGLLMPRSHIHRAPHDFSCPAGCHGF